jgi:hypothetical protein
MSNCEYSKMSHDEKISLVDEVLMRRNCLGSFYFIGDMLEEYKKLLNDSNNKLTKKDERC